MTPKFRIIPFGEFDASFACSECDTLDFECVTDVGDEMHFDMAQMAGELLAHAAIHQIAEQIEKANRRMENTDDSPA